MQPKNGKVYQCRPFPYSGYCVQWSQHASQYEPGLALTGRWHGPKSPNNFSRRLTPYADSALRYPLFSFAKCGLLNDKAASTLYNGPRQSDYI